MTLSKLEHRATALGTATRFGLVLSLCCPSAFAWAQQPEEPEIGSEELAIIEARLASPQPSALELTLQAGGTAFISAQIAVPRTQVRAGPSAYEGIMTGLAATPGFQVHKRVDRFSFLERGNSVEVSFTYVVVREPSGPTRGTVRATFELRERAGLGNTVARQAVQHRVKGRPSAASPDELQADFLGYRFFLRRAGRRLSALRKAGLRSLSLQDEGPIPVTDRLSPKGVQQLQAFERDRRRVWVARRNLAAAAASEDSSRAKLAETYLRNLERAAADWKGLPVLGLSPNTSQTAPNREPRNEQQLSKEGAGGTLAPVSEYVPGSEGSIQSPTSQPEADGIARDAPAPDGVDPKVGAPDVGTSETPTPISPSTSDPSLQAVSEGLEPVPQDLSDPQRLGKRYYLPSYPRGLLLDDPNIAHAGAVRASFAEVSRPEQASILALFYFAQVGLTSDLGLEVTLPTQLLEVDIGGEGQSLYRLGNPLLAVKYRFHLPSLRGRRPTLTVRGRWGIAATQRNQVPASDYFSEDFSFSPNITDTYAFLLEQTDIGVGGNLAWRYRWLHLGLQLYSDYLFPTGVSDERPSFLALSYGASVGALPFGDVVGLYLETRAVSMLGGPQRTDLVVYGGARGRFLGFIEPAIWLGIPAGSVTEVTGAQIGAELRISYDVRSIVEVGGRRGNTLGY